MSAAGGRPPRAAALATVLTASLLGGATCGGRTELDVPPPLPPKPECDVDADCPGFDDLCRPVRCVDPQEHLDVLPELPSGVALPPRVCLVIDPVDCDDNDPCTAGTCNPETGLCSYGPSTLDLDGDGFRAPLPGKQPGEAGACGDDCNDASPAAFPGNVEICDGIDNDCNGVVDDGATFVPLNEQPVRISSNSVVPSNVGGLAFNGETYMSIYTGSSSGTDMYQTRLLPDGTKVAPIEEKFTFQNADSSGGPITWIGDRYGIAWQDRRDGDYEIYFTILKPDGGKAYPDTRLTFAFDFSVYPEIAWTGNEFVVAWQDRRNGIFQIMAQRVSIESAPIGGNVNLTTPDFADTESPAIAMGLSSLGLTFTTGGPASRVVRFQSFDPSTLEARISAVDLTPPGVAATSPRIIWNQDRFLVTWYETNPGPKAVFAAAVREDGEIVIPRTAVSQPGANHSRYPSLLALGDRVLFVYADDRDGNNGYELYTRMVTTDLVPLSPETRVTNAPFNSIDPIPAFGPDGDVGILFLDEREAGADHVWFTRLGCVVP